MPKRKKQGKREATTSSYLVSLRITTKNEGGVAPATQKEIIGAVDGALTRRAINDGLFTGVDVTGLVVGVGGESDAGEE